MKLSDALKLSLKKNGYGALPVLDRPTAAQRQEERKKRSREILERDFNLVVSG